MSDDPLLDSVIDAVAPYTRAKRERIRPEGRLIDFGIDSVNAKQILVDLERAHGLEIPDRDVIDLDSIGAIADYLRGRLAE